MVDKGSSSTSLGVILTPNGYKGYLHLTQATKSASISYVAWTSNTFTCLTHSSLLGPWILESEAFDYLSGNNDFSPLTIRSPLPLITLANGSKTIAK